MNLLTILLAALAAFLVGALWYGVLFAKPWQRAAGLLAADISSARIPLLLALTFAFEVLMATTLAHAFERLGNPPDHVKMMMAGGMALGFVIPATGVNYLYLRKSGRLFLIDAGHWLFAFLAIGAVFVALG
jgi:hypothetical protein